VILCPVVAKENAIKWQPISGKNASARIAIKRKFVNEEA
jgi:hypothetical protein